MRLIDAERLFYVVQGHHDLYRGATIATDKARRDECLQIMCDINDSPTIDAVPVVRCRECKYWTSINNEETYGWCYFDDKATSKAKHFCAYGQRREEAPS